MKRRLARQLAKRKRRIKRRLDKARRRWDSGRPVLPPTKVTYEVSERVRAMPHGGMAVVHQLVLGTGLVARLDGALELLKVHRPYYESDHVLNIAYNAMCGGQTLEEIELRRNDEVYLDGLGVEAVPDPTTAGDFCRRFGADDIVHLMGAINETRLEVWSRLGSDFFEGRARIDGDGTLVGTTGECKEGMALSHKGVWGYHPLLISLANTKEPLFIINRSGNRPSHEGAADYYDQAGTLCRRAGFREVLYRGDTDFSQTQHLDRWDAEEGTYFVFGYDASKGLKGRADALAEADYGELVRRAKSTFVEQERRRARPRRHKEEFVRIKGYKNIRLRSEDIAEFEYSPRACKKTYRMVVLRKNLSVERGDDVLFDDIRYFFYITNDRSMSAAQVVYESNDRCDQENLIEQLKNGVRALHAPVNTLNANWAYMVMTSLAWTLKAWMALSLPVSPRWRERHLHQMRSWLRMDFRTFRKAVIDFPVQILADIFQVRPH